MNENETWVWLVGIISMAVVLISIVSAICDVMKSKRDVGLKRDEQFSYGWTFGDDLDDQIVYLFRVFKRRIEVVFRNSSKDSPLCTYMESLQFELSHYGFSSLIDVIDAKILHVKSLDVENEILHQRSIELLVWFRNEVEIFLACEMAEDDDLDDF